MTFLLLGAAPRSSVGTYLISLIGVGKTLRRKSLSRAISSGIPEDFPNTILKVQSINNGANLTGVSLQQGTTTFLGINASTGCNGKHFPPISYKESRSSQFWVKYRKL
ncbi:MAG: hypothetical protein FWB90_04895, partial [Fibromonadales bacterium]|nr:hypothetical protein [Fibromonadales bacterium]